MLLDLSPAFDTNSSPTFFWGDWKPHLIYADEFRSDLSEIYQLVSVDYSVFLKVPF